MTIFALIVAAGESRRMGGSTPKPYLPLAGKPVLRHTVEAFLNHPLIDGVQVVIHESHSKIYSEAMIGLNLLPPIIGGNTRQSSVLNGLEALAKYHPHSVLIHDAARPLIDAETITRVIKALHTGHKAVIPTVCLKDTLKKIADSHVIDTPDRNQHVLAQTPQGFAFDVLYPLHQAALSHDFTDDAALIEAAGIPVFISEGNPRNFKLTTTQDRVMAEQMLATQWEYRTGNGFDVHRLVTSTPEKPCIHLCGVAIPYPHTLSGHSDADVGIHALVDALCGAIAEGDIGQHFPPSDARWKNADSAMFLRHACALVSEKGSQIVNVDVTLIGEEPRISPHRSTMREKLAEIMDLPLHRVSVKATTTEKLGFTGRKEGLAAQATATVKLPFSGCNS